MARPLRIEYEGALYHVTSRGNGQEAIYLADEDREDFNEVLEAVRGRFNWVIHAACQMTNHYHLLVETPAANLSRGMRQLNGVYTQRFNRRHGRVGHIFQGRFKAIVVERESYLLELARYIVLNPVRASMVRSAKDWSWSSYRATAGMVPLAQWLTVDEILSAFGRRKGQAREAYRAFVAEGRGQPSPWSELTGQIYLGSQSFVERIQARGGAGEDLSEIPRVQRRRPLKPLTHYQAQARSRDEAIVGAYESGGYTLKELGEHFGLHYSRVSRIVKSAEQPRSKT